MTRFRSRQLSPLVYLLVFGTLMAGCGGGGGDGGTPPSTTAIAKASTNSGDAQSGTVGQPLPNSLQVTVTEGGVPSAGSTVSWSTTVPGGSLAASSTTDASGIASSAWTLGTVSGSQTARATLTGATGSPVIFSATAAADAPATLVQAGGNGQIGVINTQLAAPVQAKVADQFGNGVPAVDVGWAATGGTVSAATVPSNAAGISAVNVTAGGTAGPITITATAGSLTGSPLTFTATATTAPTTAAVSVVNNSFNPSAITVAAGTTVVWTWNSTAMQHNVTPDGTVPARSGNPVNGPATYQFRFDTPGTYGYYCEVHGGPGGSLMSGTVTVQ